jgi:hypothetical protein
MTSPSEPAILRRLRQFVGEESGVSAVEFAMLLPLMITLYLGSVEITQGFSANRKATLVASTIGDLIARTDTTCIAQSVITTTFAAGEAILYPFDKTKLKMVITHVIVDDKQQATVQSAAGGWSRTWGDGAVGHSGEDVTGIIPAPLRATPGVVIWAEAYYKYVPTISRFIAKEGIELHETVFLKPRLGKPTPICS